MGYESVSYRTPDFYTQQVFSGLFGGGMSSRLFQEVREKHGLCYSIYSTSWSLDDTGMFAIHAATSQGHARQADRSRAGGVRRDRRNRRRLRARSSAPRRS